jgi:N-acetylglucosaminyldiphosphoundecaprenol N-acetyl-beta-D-mannosaminyltransferase
MSIGTRFCNKNRGRVSLKEVGNYDCLNAVEIFGYNVFNDDLEKIGFEGKKIINTISPISYARSTMDAEYRKALLSSNILTLDGEYFGLAAFFLRGKIIKKYQGLDNFRCFMQKANEISGRVFFLGSTERTLVLMKDRANREYPNITIKIYSPPFKNEFDDNDNINMINFINDFKPHLLCIGMTAPKQEKWAYKHYKQLNVNVIITIGQVFDWYAGVMKEPHPLWAKIHLLWLIRTIRRPEILKRYPLIFKFAWHLILNIIRVRKD